MLEFFQATTSFNLPPVRRCGRKGVAYVMKLPAFATGGQQGVIAQDWRLRQAGAKEGAPSSRKSLFLIIACIGDVLFQKVLIFIYYLYLGQSLPKSLTLYL